jgi:hypothetical protein
MGYNNNVLGMMEIIRILCKNCICNEYWMLYNGLIRDNYNNQSEIYQTWN